VLCSEFAVDYLNSPEPRRHLVWGMSKQEAERGAPLTAIDRATSEEEALQSLKTYAQLYLRCGTARIIHGVEFGQIGEHTGWFAIWS